MRNIPPRIRRPANPTHPQDRYDKVGVRHQSLPCDLLYGIRNNAKPPPANMSGQCRVGCRAILRIEVCINAVQPTDSSNTIRSAIAKSRLQFLTIKCPLQHRVPRTFLVVCSASSAVTMEVRFVRSCRVCFVVLIQEKSNAGSQEK